MSECSPSSPCSLWAVLVLGGTLLTGASCGDVVPTPADALRDPSPRRAAEGLDLGPERARPAEGADAAWLPQPPVMNPARARHSASLLPSGWVLLTGGRAADGNPLASGQLYDPLTNGWVTPAPQSMNAAREDHAAATLLDGRVLVVGGYASAAVQICETYASNAWTTVASLSSGRYRHTATLLEDGTVLVVGGQNTNDAVQNLVSLYTPVAAPGVGAWSSRTLLNLARSLHAATRLSDGKVLVTGGYIGGTSTTADATIYDWPNDAWITAAPMNHARQQHTATLLEGGDVLAVGWDAPYPERYNASSNTWADIPAMNADNTRFRHTATLLPNGCVLIAGGHYGQGGGPYTYTADVELYDPIANTWTTTVPLMVSRSRHTATLLDGGVVMIAGGDTDGAVRVDVVERYALGQQGDPCASPCECLSGFCADGVCCDSACDAGACDACSVATGAVTDGACVQFSSNTCHKSETCTTEGVCQDGTCVGSNPVVCPPPSECQEDNVCEPTTGECVEVPKPSGTPCQDGICQAGVCIPDSQSSAAASSSSGTSSGAGGGDADDDEGCSCRVSGGARRAVAPSLSQLLLLVAAWRRATSRASRRCHRGRRSIPH